MYWFILPLYFRYIRIYIHLFVDVISMVTTICSCNSYNLLLGCSISWELCRAYFLCSICCFVFLVRIDLHSQKWINISLFELGFTCIKTHIFFLVSQYLVFYFYYKVFSFVYHYSYVRFSLEISNTRHTYNIISRLPLSKYKVFHVSYLATRGSNA